MEFLVAHVFSSESWKIVFDWDYICDCEALWHPGQWQKWCRTFKEIGRNTKTIFQCELKVKKQSRGTGGVLWFPQRWCIVVSAEVVYCGFRRGGVLWFPQRWCIVVSAKDITRVIIQKVLRPQNISQLRSYLVMCCVLKRDTNKQGCTWVEGTVNTFVDERKMVLLWERYNKTDKE